MGAGTYSYDYDPIGNRNRAVTNAVITDYQANGLNQYTNITGGMVAAPLHDLDGNLLQDSRFKYTWDAENRLVGLSNLVSGEVSEYYYDHQSRRIAKTVLDPSLSTVEASYFLYDGWNLIGELKDDQTTVSTNLYVWGLDVSGSLQGAGGVGGLLTIIISNTSYFTAYVNLFNVSEYISSDGFVSAHYEYDSFGNTTLAEGSMAAAFPFRFSTKYYDAESGFYYYGYRYLEPPTGRWLNRDPIGERGGLLLYGFAGNSPVDSWDYLGCTKSCDCVGDLKKLLDSSPSKEKVADLKERKCINGDPKCGSCDKPSTLGGYHLDNKTPKDWPHSKVGSIVICADENIPRHDNIEEVLRHEMQHADWQCGEPICGKESIDTMSCCAKMLCHEMKAYFCESPKNNWTWDELAEAAYNSIAGKDCARWFTKESIKWNTRKICPGPLPKHKNNCYITFPETKD